jgi:hypothetical protein
MDQDVDKFGRLGIEVWAHLNLTIGYDPNLD